VFDVGQFEPDEFTAAQGRGVAEQDDRGVPGPDWRAAVDAGDDLADLLDGEGTGQATGCGAVGADQASTNLPDRLGGDRVLGSGHPVDVSDGGAGLSRVLIALPSSARSVR
jgi:hypothetical protein